MANPFRAARSREDESLKSGDAKSFFFYFSLFLEQKVKWDVGQ